MNYLPFVGFGFYGAASDAERPCFYASWGLLEDAPNPSEAPATTPVKKWYKKVNLRRGRKF